MVVAEVVLLEQGPVELVAPLLDALDLAGLAAHLVRGRVRARVS